MSIQILETLKLETKVKQYEGDAKASGATANKLEEAGKGPEIGNLKRKLEIKDKELKAMKSQAEGLQKEYRELADKYSKQNPDFTPKKDR